MGQTFILERDGVQREIQGLRHDSEHCIDTDAATELLVGDVLTLKATGQRYAIERVGADVVGETVIHRSAWYQNPAAVPPPPTYQIHTVNNSILGNQQHAQQINVSAPSNELAALLAELRALTAGVAPEQQAEARRVIRRAEQAVEEATDPEGDKDAARVSAEGLKKAAANLGAALPAIIPVANRIAQEIQKYL